MDLQRLRILHVVEATTGGVGRHVIDLATAMQRLGPAVTVACPPVRDRARRDTAFVERLRAAHIPVAILPLRSGIHPLADARGYARLVSLLRETRFDVVHSHSSKAGALGRLAARRCGVPASVYTPNAFAFLGASNPLTRWLYRTIERRLGRRWTDALICVSPSERDLTLRQAIAPPERVVVIENAIDARRFAPRLDRAAAKTALGLDPARQTVGYVGRLVPQKGVDTLLQAAQQVLARRDDVQFALVGEGELETMARRLIEQQGWRDRVILTGYRTDIPRVLAAVELFVLPSRYEGLPYTLLEAMAAGRAVIAADIAGNRDLIRPGQTGLLVPPDDAPALAGAILDLLADPARRERLGAGAWAAAQARPTPEEMARRVLDLYRRILGDC